MVSLIGLANFVLRFIWFLKLCARLSWEIGCYVRIASGAKKNDRVGAIDAPSDS